MYKYTDFIGDISPIYRMSAALKRNSTPIIEINIGKKSTKSAIYRSRTDKSRSRHAELPEEDIKKSPKISPIFRYFIGIFTDFSGNFPIFPASPARAQDTKSVLFFFEKT